MNRLIQFVVMSLMAGVCAFSCAQQSTRPITGLGGVETFGAGMDATSSTASAWEKLRVEPGIPGVDYDPQELLVIFKNVPNLSMSHTQSPVDETKLIPAVGSMPNSILRQNKQYVPITDLIADKFGLEIRQQVYHGNINAASFRITNGADGEAVLEAIRLQFSSQVAHAIFSPLHHAAYIPNDPDFMEGADGRQWELWRVGCPGAWDYELGSESVRIAVVDTGVRITHEELVGQVLDPAVHFPEHALDVYHNDNTVEDLDGHGTFIAGLAVATGDNGNKMTGVAPGCRVIPIKVSDDLGAQTLDIVAGCLLALDLGARVINLSFSTDSELPIERDMVDQIWDGGAILVSVAANFGADTVQYPGAFANAVCVGGTNQDDERWEFSNYGSTVNIAAPAIQLRSCNNNANDAGYFSNGSGTSYSAGIISGGFGLVFSLGADVTNADAREALEASGMVVDGFTGVVRLMDVGAAVTELVSNNYARATQLVAGPRVCGTAIEEYYLGLSVEGCTNVAKVVYTLDIEPVGVIDENDIMIASMAGEPFTAQLLLPQDCLNQQARVLGECYSSFDIVGQTLECDVFIFNDLGDIDCDGTVDELDVELLKSKLGLTAGDPEYTIFADTNLDGVINEMDLAQIGYRWGS